jgi:hypothetical protein
MALELKLWGLGNFVAHLIKYTKAWYDQGPAEPAPSRGKQLEICAIGNKQPRVATVPPAGTLLPMTRAENSLLMKSSTVTESCDILQSLLWQACTHPTELYRFEETDFDTGVPPAVNKRPTNRMLVPVPRRGCTLFQVP